MGASEVLEHMEHAGHAGHGGHGSGDSLGARIGITMALLGVVLALMGALLGAARTEVIAALTNQNIAQTKFQGNAARFRTLRTQLAALTAVTPPAADLAAAEKAVAAAGATVTEPSAHGVYESVAQLGRVLLRAAEPDAAAMRRMIRITKKFRRERDAAGKWSDAYMPLVEDHFFAAEHYEQAQLGAEIGIIVASIALLRKSRGMWLLAAALGAVAVAVAAWTHVASHGRIVADEATMEAAKEEFFGLKSAQNETADDDAAIAAAEARFPAAAGEAVDYEAPREKEPKKE